MSLALLGARRTTILGPAQPRHRCTDEPCGADNLSGVEQGARPDDAPARSHASPGGIVAAIGSALVVASTFFELVSATVGPEGRNQLSSSRAYRDSDNGKIVLVLGLLALVVSAATLIRPRRDIVWPIVVAACSLA